MDMKAYWLKRKSFVEKLGELIAIAKPNLVRCEHIKVNEDDVDDQDEIVRVHCANSFYYDIDITADSEMDIINDVSKRIMYK